MHEASIVLGILNIVEEEAKRLHLNKVNKITMCLGEFTCAEVQTLRDCFELVAEPTLAAEAELIIESVKATAKCNRCRKVFPVKKQEMECPYCGSKTMRLKSGRELYVKSFEAD
ncbi:MAG: hydrogenase maturation nickel metallochaperone HypA [Spirochaetales bacterium]|nr:hydrogenase maturation nickel metallochaperone HypA [Spirochaetales bacterium]